MKDPSDPALANDEAVKTYLANVTTANKNNSIAVAGWIQADLLINTLKAAAASPGGLTHANVLAAARDMTYATPMFINGIKWISSPTELIGISAFQTMVWKAAEKKFQPDGGLIEVGAK
jgi:hypothetical protein